MYKISSPQINIAGLKSSGIWLFGVAGSALRRPLQLFRSYPNLFLLTATAFCALFTLSFSASAQTKPLINSTLNGTVIDAKTKATLPGAVVHIQGTTHEVITDEKGKFRFVTGQKFPYTLQVKYIGYNPAEVVANSETITVALQEAVNQLQDVVVVGYGTQKKKDVTGALSSVSAQQIQNTPAASFDKVLQGSVPGIQVTQSSGAPGASTTVRIRGGNSINGGNEPLYVIDGFPIYNDNGAVNTGALSGAPLNALSTINTSDIESMEVLKDASATAIYGSRGANGVIIVTTKRGKKGSNTISYDGFYGVQKTTRSIPLLNGSQWAQLSNDAFVNNGQAAPYTAAQVTAFGTGTNWQDAAFRTAPTQNHQLSISGGDEKTQYSISGNYVKQDGILQNTDFGRYSGRVNLDRNVTEHFKVGTSITGSRLTSNIAPESSVRDVLSLPPIVPVTSLFYGATGNPVTTLNLSTNQSITSRFISNFYGEYRFLESFTARVTIGTDVLNTKQNNYFPRNTYTGSLTNGAGAIGSQSATSWLNENTLNYKKTFGIHQIDAIVGYTYQSLASEGVLTRAQNFPNDQLGYTGLGSGSVPFLPVTSQADSKLSSYLGRINYTLDGKYLLTLTGRGDGSSRFGANKKWGFFPSAALAWNASEEDFIKNLKGISNLKFRLSAGATGNQQIGQYLSLAQLDPYSYVFGDNVITGYAPSRIANPNLGWETTYQYNGGIDAGFLNDRISFNFDLYYKKTKDLLLDIPVPETSGFYTSLQNIGQVENKGIELNLNTRNFTGKFNWTTNLVFALNRNKVLDLGNVQQFLPDGGTERNIRNPTIVQVGKPIGQFYGYKTNGVLQAADVGKVAVASGFTKAGDQRYVDINGDGVINSDGDRVVLGSAQPKFTGGVTNTFDFKGFDLTVFFQGVYGNSILNYNRADLETFTGNRQVSTAALDRWTPQNTNTNIPRANASASAVLLSDRFIEDGSYLRLKNVVFGYSLPASLINKIGVKRARVYVSAQNLVTFTKYSGYDPEVSRNEQSNLYSGIDFGNYPNYRSFIAGINLSF